MPFIFAIDPGNEKSTTVYWHSEIGRLIETQEWHNEDLIDAMHGLSCDEVVCEMVACYGMAVGKEVFETCRWIGRFEQVAYDGKIDFHSVYRKDVKMNLCQSMLAKDANIRQALIDRFGVVGTKKNPGPLFGISKHGWSALAVAVTYADSLKEKSNSALQTSVH